MLQLANSVAKSFYQYGSLFLKQTRPFRIITHYRDCFVDLHIFTNTGATCSAAPRRLMSYDWYIHASDVLTMPIR
jgi:hypothetical protein